MPPPPPLGLSQHNQDLAQLYDQWDNIILQTVDIRLQQTSPKMSIDSER